MSINLDEAMEEYARLPFEPCGAHYKKYCVNHCESLYHTTCSSFIFALDGKATIYLDDKPFTFAKNRIIHCAPNQRFTAQNEKGQPAMLFELAYCNDSPYSDYMNSAYELEIYNNSCLISMLSNLTQLSQSVYPNMNAKTILQAKTITYAIMSEVFFSAQRVERDSVYQMVEDAKMYIERCYMESFTLARLGRRYGLSEKYFASRFKQYVGASPIEYLTICRMNVARELLATTTLSIKEVSYQVGYEDALYFSRQFKSRFGVSPSQWKNQ